jgi:hypothetical protein
MSWVICGGALIPKNPPFGGRASGAVIKVLNPRPIPYENNIPRCSALNLIHNSGFDYTVL